MDKLDQLFNRFESDQSLSAMQDIKNEGVNFKILRNNKWDTLHEFDLPIPRFVRLYNDRFQLSGIGVY